MTAFQPEPVRGAEQERCRQGSAACSAEVIFCTSSGDERSACASPDICSDGEVGCNGGGYDLSNSLSDLSDSGSEHASDDALAQEAEQEEREYTGFFEGPEKTLEVCFKPGVGDQHGCRALTRAQLDQICKRARCTILSRMSNAHLDAYVLSESSLFVYRHKVVVKTCGTTTLLRCIAYLLQHAGRGLGMELEWVGYSRKNFTFPGDQLYPHASFEQELDYLRQHQHLSARLDGSGHVLGPVTGDHWFVYVADKYDRPNFTATDRVINIMMFDLHPDCAAKFVRGDAAAGADGTAVSARAAGRDMTVASGVADLVPGATVDACAFEPCGYSMNAIQFESYYTIHVTPEAACSYASFETNNPYRSYRSIVNNVLNVFRPRRFVLTMMADEAGLKTMAESPFDQLSLPAPAFGGAAAYARTSMCSTKVEGDCCLLLANYNLKATRPVLNRARTHSHC
ncbi:S-Adenosylmethionine decarboxylase [Tribonema minus]|uniref:adenosylmethionine decarboxylase n=1 Tax=Tribonema minus TaxID=303371 RepID=A0A835ZL65_9STRA|nr:S-Adenosylmethionine decarboxylase [Tribonema minus]